MKWIILLPALCLALAMLVIPAAASAGDGGYNDSGYDAGGSGEPYEDDDWNRGTSALVLPLILFLLFSRSRRIIAEAVGEAPEDNDAVPVRQVDHKSLEQLQRKDPSFDPQAIEEVVRQWVPQLESAWCGLDMTPCRGYLSESLFDSIQARLAQMNRTGKLPRIRESAVTDCTLESWEDRGCEEYLDLWIEEHKRTYVVSAYDLNQVIEGDSDRVCRLFYRWRLVRTKSDRAWRVHLVQELAQMDS